MVLSGGDPNGLIHFPPHFCVLWCWAWCWHMLCPCLVQEANEIQKDVAEGYKACGGHGPNCPQGKSCVCVVDFFVLPCSLVRGVCLELLYQ